VSTDRLPLTLDYAVTAQVLTAFIEDEVRKSGFDRVVVGLSGGVDSATSAALAAKALGPQSVWGLLLPYRESSPESRVHAELVVRWLEIQSETIDITPMIDAYFTREPEADRMRRGNKMARERMTILYDYSAKLRALVLGTSNKTELLLGYGTLYGDMASALNPLGDLYKTHVRALARHLGVPAAIVEKAPSADLWKGQTDEAELGFTYEEVDQLLYHMVDLRYDTAALLAAGFDERFVQAVAERVRASQYKRRPPVIAKISRRTIDRDFRYPRDWGL
jgi:NAD+ synthase